MKVLYDTNVLISYLLTSENRGTIATIIERGFEGDYQFIIPQDVIYELRKKLSEKEWLVTRITKSTDEKFINALLLIAVIPIPITEPIPEVGRDVKDDYLLAYGIVSECNYLVTGDPDLLIIKEISNLKIVSPIQFYDILNK